MYQYFLLIRADVCGTARLPPAAPQQRLTRSSSTDGADLAECATACEPAFELACEVVCELAYELACELACGGLA